MRLKKLALHRFPGFRRSFSLENLHPGLNIIVGPNASGKTSICYAVRRLLWPQSNKRWPAMSIESEWVSDRGSMTLTVNEACSKSNPVFVEPREALHANALPDEAFLSCFSMTIDELFDEKDLHFAQKMAQEMAGGFDVEAAQARSTPAPNWRAPLRDWKEMGQRVAAYQQMQEEVREESRQLPELEAGIQTALRAQRELVRLEKQIRWREEKNKLEAQQLHLRSFPEPLRAARIQPTDWKDYELWQERKEEIQRRKKELVAQEADLAQQLGSWSPPSFSKEEWEGQWERVGRLQRLELEKRELRRKIEKLQSTVQAQQQFLGMTEAAGIEGLCMEGLDPLASLWHELDKMGAELGGIEEQIRLCDVPLLDAENGALSSLPKMSSEKSRRWIEGLCALALYPQRVQVYEGLCLVASLLLIGYGGWVLDPLHGRWWAGLAACQLVLGAPWVYRYLRRRALSRQYDLEQGGLFPLSKKLSPKESAQALEAMIQYKSYWAGVERSLQRKNDLEARWKQKNQERQETTERLHALAELANLRHLCRTHGELIEHLKTLHRDAVLLKELKWEEVHLTEDWEREWSAWESFVRAWGEIPETGGDYLGIYTRMKERRGDAETLLATRTQIAGCEKELAAWHEKMETLLRQTKTVGHPEKLKALVALWPEYQQELEKLKNLQRQVESLEEEGVVYRNNLKNQNYDEKPTSPKTDSSGCFGINPKSSLEALEEEKCAKEAEARTLSDLSERKGKVVARIQQMEQALEGEALLQGYEEKREELCKLSLDFVKKELTAILVDGARKEFQEESQPWVLEKATEWFYRFTKCQFQLELPKSTAAPTSYQVLETATGMRKNFDQLSRGTRMQLLMAVRLAFAFHSEMGGESLPLFLDEVLANTDAERFEAVAQVMAELLATGRQVFYLTCNREDAIKWKKVCPEAHVIDLAEIQAEQAYFSAAALTVAESTKIPHPEESSLEEYIQRLKLPSWRLDEPVQQVSIHYLVDNVHDLYRLLSGGIACYGNLQSQKREWVEQAFPQSFSTMLRRGELLEQFFALKTQGRGKLLSKEVLVKGGVSSHFARGLWDMAQEVHRDAQQLVAILEDKKYKDERKKGFRLEAKKALRAFLLEEGYIDPRPILSDEAVRCALLPLTEAEEDRLFLEYLAT